MAGYALKATYPTVQVLSPSLVNNVEYATIQTTPSLVIASMPIQKDVFDAGGGGPELRAFANAIEQIMADDRVVAAAGTQSLTQSGLTQDYVTFTVQYVPPGSSGTSITADADVRVASLNFEDGEIGRTLLASVEAIIDATYNNLVATANG